MAGQDLPQGGLTTWEMEDVTEIVTFALVDPETVAHSFPEGLGFLPAAAVPMPEIQEHIRQHPEHATYAFTVVEVAHQGVFRIDGKSPAMPPDGAIGLWLAPVDPTDLMTEHAEHPAAELLASAEGAVVSLGVWAPDREYVGYMRECGHFGEYGMATLRTDDAGKLSGVIQLDNLRITASAQPIGEAQIDPRSGAQVMFWPGEQITRGAVITASGSSNQPCEAEWTAEGDHPLAHAVFVGPTYRTRYAQPMLGSAYDLRSEESSNP